MGEENPDGSPSRAAKVLIMGFSVTGARSGYAQVLQDAAAAGALADVEILRCGLAGLTPLPLAVVYERAAAKRGPFDYVFLEIATSIYGARIADWPNEGLDLLYDLFDRIAQSGAGVGLINLYRDDFDYPYHLYDMMLEALAARHGLPLLDLGAGLARREGATFCKALLRDTVHTNAEGSRFQAEAVGDFIREALRANRRPQDLPKPRRRAREVDVATACGLPSRDFSAYGVETVHGVLSAGEGCVAKLPAGALLYGISYVSGPRSGELELHLHGVDSIVPVMTYDEFCFVERYNFSAIRTTEACTGVAITLKDAMPDIRLLKGEADLSPREAYPIALHYFEKAP